MGKYYDLKVKMKAGRMRNAMHSFNTGDHPTDSNLSRLGHFASWTQFNGGYRGIDDWLVSVIDTIHVLPPAAQAM